MKPDLSLLKAVLKLPTAPFHEEAVSGFIRSFVKKLGLNCQQDRCGNLKVVYQNGKGRTPFVLAAHMDHPGFEVIRRGKNPIVQLLGGVPDRYFKKAKVVVWQDGRPMRSKVLGVFNEKKRQYRLRLPPSVSKGAFGYFDLPAVRLRQGLIQTKAADDLINVALLLNFLQELVHRRASAHVIFIFTRAEEVGFVGTLGMIRHQFISQKSPVIVLEASSAKAGKVQIGGGPVLRVGDKASTFSHAIDLWLQQAAAGLKTQRALLSGGRCESTVYIAKGYQSGCLALPLGNYHNIGKKNYAMEYVSLSDYKTMLLWLGALVKAKPPKVIAQKKAAELDKFFQQYGSRLKTVAER